MIFNYKDWYHWTFLIVLTICVMDLILTIDTWTRWKWGYFSIDAIPALIVLGLLAYWSFVIMDYRMLRRLDKLEKSLEDLKETEA